MSGRAGATILDAVMAVADLGSSETVMALMVILGESLAKVDVCRTDLLVLGTVQANGMTIEESVEVCDQLQAAGVRFEAILAAVRERAA